MLPRAIIIAYLAGLSAVLSLPSSTGSAMYLHPRATIHTRANPDVNDDRKWSLGSGGNGGQFSANQGPGFSDNPGQNTRKGKGTAKGNYTSGKPKNGPNHPRKN
ncbi:hypothetical protein MJO28_013316 [Puccinia striiformis f. sp. tritici]|uniref:Secreted protein n=2 Tax=Puccinia striiformis f. sp. tritici TaxID=168172 RepID=A0A0L0VZA6_9BASI|nr:hypothetical protein Pst134EB_024907 [Puccinia striiformis f. sp. tritici]KAI7941031.1 hypothetical protein MJO28_013316 [Puccinia striiformis f. sp. tritici]KNF04583.1 hypothetical protein PSTG_02494 [Puccinia striiformis f. sp. tritici PST-78]